MDEQNDVLGTLRRETVRTILERAQGEMIKNNNEPSQEDETPEGVVEELDVAYVNREGVPLAMDIIGPAATEGVDLPVIITIHGGGLISGTRRYSKSFARNLAQRGYLVFSIEYRLAPRANVCEQFDDVCAGMDLIGKRLVNYDVDFGRIFLTSDSAGAFLAIYVAAMKDSPKLQKAIGYEPTRMRFRALGLISGMFYTNRADPLGILLAEQFYGEKRADEEFLRYTDPEHHEIVKNLPPCFFITSRGDFLNDYTLSYHRVLKNEGKKTHLLYFKEDDLGHAFVVMNPDLKQGQKAIDKMCAWFEGVADETSQTLASPSGSSDLELLRGRIDSGELQHQKSWQFIRELNSVSETRLDSPALIDDGRTYTYRQFFREQDRYAEVFSALGITQQNGSRVGLVEGGTAQSIIAFYALNMVGTSVSILRGDDVLVKKQVKRSIEDEGITDLIIPDYCVDAKLLRGIVRFKKSLGIRHVVVLHASKGRTFASKLSEERARQNYRELKKVKGALFMPKLLLTYETTPIAYVRDQNDEAAVITHTSGTTKAVRKPIPLSDYGLNAASVRFFDNQLFLPLVGKAVSAYTLTAGSAYGMVDMIHLPLSLGCAIVFYEGTISRIPLRTQWLQLVEKKNVNVLFTAGNIVNMWWNDPGIKDLDLSSLSHVIFGGGNLSNDQIRRARKMFKKCGAKPVLINGYGTSECGGAAIIHVCDDKSKKGHQKIGVPLKGVEALVQDVQTGEFHSLDEGPCTGVLYVASETNSCGRLNGKVIFELEEIDGKKYFCTNDMVQVDESGILTHIGRGNRYFVDDKGVRFEAGVVETAIANQSGISQCAIVPAFDRLTVHDTVPVLYVSLAKGSNGRKIVQKALANAYINDDEVAGNSLPWRCVICKSLPNNDSGKVDITRVMQERTKGDVYTVTAVKKGDRLKDVKLERADTKMRGLSMVTPEGVPSTIERERRTLEKNFSRVYGVEQMSIMMQMMQKNMGIKAPLQLGSNGGRLGVLPFLSPLLYMQHEGKWKEGAAMGKKQKMPMMPGMPMMGGMPMMPMGPGPKGGKKGKKNKGKKGPKGGFAPMMFMMPMMAMGPGFKGPKDGKKGKKNKGKKAPKRPGCCFAPMMPMGPGPKRGKKGSKGPKRPGCGFAPMMPMGPGPKRRKGPKGRKGPKHFA